MRLNRRQLVTSIATGLLGVGIGTQTHLLSQSAKAEVSMGELSIDGAEKTTQDGTVEDVVVSLNGDWSYEVPGSKNPKKWQVVLWTVRGDEKEPVGVAEGSAKYLSGQGSYELENSLTQTDLWSVGDFEEGTDGETKQTEVGFLLVFNVFNDRENVIAQDKVETTATVEITNNGYKISEHGDVSGDGGVTIVG